MEFGSHDFTDLRRFSTPVQQHQSTENDTHNHLTALFPGLPGWAGTRKIICLLTPILIIEHPLSTSSIYYDPYHPSCSKY